MRGAFKIRGHRPGGDRHRRLSAGLLAAATVCLAAVGLHACDDDGTGPEVLKPGNLAVTLVSPNGEEGAVVLETLERGITGVTMSGGRAFLGGSGLRTRIVALLAAPGEISLTLAVDNVDRPPRLRIVEVADSANRRRGDLSDYSLSVDVVSAAIATGEVAP